MNILKLVLFAFLFSNGVASQNILISQGGNVNVSGGEIFYDAGGSAGNDGNTSYTITLSPPVGQSVCVDFISFSSFESFDIFDGTTVAANNIGSLKGNYGTAYNAAGAPYNTGQPALGAAVQAELKPGIFCANSASGALTFRFTNSSASQSTGWIGNVITYAKPTTGCTVNLTASPTTLCLGSATTLTATGTIGSALINNDFNASTLGTGWSATPGGVAFVNVLGCQPNYGYNTQNTDSSVFAWMQNVVAPRVLESNGFDVSNGGVLSFDFREASDDNGGNGCEALDDREGVYIQYSTNNGTSWNNMKLMFASVESNFPSAANIGCGTYVYNWNTTTVPIPAAAMSTNTKFRWYQNSSTTASQDSWGIDNVKIIKNNPITLTIIDLSTSVVVATASTNTVSVSVSPTSTRTYRATISDGITSCTNDVLVTVNSGSATTINYSGSPFLTSAGAANVTITNGPVSGAYSSTPVGLTLNTTTGAITPSTSTSGTYTVSVPTSCGTATATVVIATSICATCATPSCPVVTITTATVALGQTGITTSLNTAGDQLGNTPLVPGQNITVCVPVTVVAGSTVLGFKQLSSSSPGGCGSPLEEVMTYQLTSTACGATIPPNVTNASGVASGFNPEWNGLTPGNYVLCFTLNVTASALCSSVDLQGLGYYNVVPLCSNPVISSQPLATQTVCRNATGTNLTVTATGSALTYQWYSNTSNSNVGGTLISSAVSATYTPSTSVAGTFYFYCIVSSGACNTTSNVSIVIINNSTVPTYTKTVVNCASGSINFSGVLPAGTTFNWLSGPSGYTFPIGFQTPLTTNTNLTALPAGTYCVDITSPTSAGGTITSTLFVETFESGLANWTLDNSNGPNIFVLNNQYAGGSCVTGLGTFTVPAVPNQPVAVTAGPNSNYLHIKATTTTGATCGVGSVNFIPLNANFDGQISDQKATLNTVINTVGKTNVRFNFYWLAQGETNANGSDDFGSIEYSINGGTTWIMSGAKLRRQTTWLSDFRTDPLWDNQANLRFRIRWNNDASSSVDPPISIDEIVITADSSTIASCGSTVNECIVILAAPAVPTVATVVATCLANGTATVSNYSAALTYTSTPAGLSVGAGGVVTGFTCGTPYTITATNAATCFATSTSFTVQCQLAVPAVPTVSTTVATCSANGTATVSNYSAALTYTSTPAGLSVGAGGVVTGFTCGTPYIITATNASTCFATSASFTVQCQLAAPGVPTVVTTAATCSANGTATVSNYSAALTYTSTPAGLSVGAGGVVTGFTCGTPYTITATNAATCSATSTSFTMQCQLTAPAVPTVSTTVATCSANGTATVSNYSAALTYTSTPAGLSVGAGGVVTGFTCGTPYTITATNASTCFATSTSFTVQCQLAAPAVPTVSTTVATCSANGTATVSNYSAALTYTSTPAGLSVGAGGVVTGFTCGTPYTITATNASTCFATSASFTVQCQLAAPAVPTVSTTVATCSANGTATVSNYSAALTYTSTPAGLSVGAGGVVSGFTCGTPYTITATNASTCFATSTSFTVQCQFSKPVLTYTVTNPICDGSTLDFVLNSNVPGTTYTWSASNNDLSGFLASGDQTNINQLVQLLNPLSTNGSISMVILPSFNGCVGDPVSVTILVRPNPRVTSITQEDDALCSGEILHMDITGEPSGLTYNWTAVNINGVLISSGVYSGTITGAIDLQLTTVNPTAAGTIQFEITPIRNGCSGTPVLSDVITVNPIPGNPIGLPQPAICSGETTNINVSENLLIAGTLLEWEVIASNNVTGFTQTGSALAPISINDLLFNNSNAQGFVTYRITSVLGECEGTFTDITVLVNPLPKPVLTDGHICVDATTGNTYQGYLLDTQLSNPNFTYEWFLLNTTTNTYETIAGANASTYEAMVEGNYQVIVTNSITNCIGEASADVIEVFPATAFTATVSDAFTNNSTITVTVNPIGTGSLIYALDDGAWQVSNVFTGVEPGSHTVLVSDLEGCTNLSIEVIVIDYPKFFTPNGDGYNDTWNIIGLNQADAKLYIFDRYGKLIKQLSTTDASKGWDGTYNGAQLPSTDYWFTLDYTENGQQKVFKSHFSLKR
jgi:gliding motility-associated-like protein